MARIVCPGCQADLEEDLIASTGESKCPFCGADLSGIRFEDSESAATSFEAALSAETALSGATDETEVTPLRREMESAGESRTGSALRADLPLPPKSRIEVVESTPDRRVIFVPAGGKGTGAIGFFAAVWNGFMLLFTSAVLLAGNQANQKNAPPWYVIVPFLGLFWSVGLGFLYFWIRMKFTRTFLLLESDRLIVQRLLFGRRKMTETFVGPETHASLTVSYEQNEQPVYCIEINGTNRTEKFGVALSDREKNWFVDSINNFLGAAGVTAACEAVLDRSGGQLVQSLSPRELPQGSEITIDDATADRLAFHFPIVPPGQRAGYWGCSSVPFLIAPILVNLVFFLADVEVNALVPGLLFALPFISLVLLTMVYRGDGQVEVTREQLSIRWRIGPFRPGQTVDNAAIQRIAIVDVADTGSRSRTKNRSQPRGVKPTKVCRAFAGEKWVTLGGVLNEVECSRQAGGLVRYQLEQMGFQISDG